MKIKREYFGVPLILVFAGFTIVASLALILFLHAYEAQHVAKGAVGGVAYVPRSVLGVIVEHLATALFVVGAWHAFEQLVVRRQFKKEILDYIDTAAGSRSFSHHGLSEVHAPREFAFETMIRNATSLVAVLGSGHRWVHNYASELEERFSDARKHTTFILMHPASELVPAVANKLDVRPDMYRQQILATVRKLETLNNGQPRLAVFGHTFINCHSVFIADERAVFSPYFLASSNQQSPVFVFANSGAEPHFHRLSRDVDQLMRKAVAIRV